jgi:hypothetical protein
MSLADETGTDVEIYRRSGADTIYADTRTTAPEQLLEFLDTLGFQRNTIPHTYVWHQLPRYLTEAEATTAASRAAAALTAAGYRTNLDPGLFDRRAYTDVLTEHAERARQSTGPARQPPAKSTGPTARPAATVLVTRRRR